MVVGCNREIHPSLQNRKSEEAIPQDLGPFDSVRVLRERPWPTQWELMSEQGRWQRQRWMSKAIVRREIGAPSGSGRYATRHQHPSSSTTTGAPLWSMKTDAG